MLNEINIKHFNHPTQVENLIAPIEIESICPACKESVIISLDSESLIPILNHSFNIELSHHSEDECSHKWNVNLIARLAVFEHFPAKYISWTTPDTKFKIIKAYRELTGVSLLEAKKWSETGPHKLNKSFGEKLQQLGAKIEWSNN